MRIDYYNPRVQTLLAAIGTPYAWGSGDLVNASWLAGSYDCSGFAQAALLELGLVEPGSWTDKTAHDLARVCDPINIGHEEPGDLGFYGAKKITHVMVCLGNGMAIGANGGTSKTHGDDPKACVQVRPVNYRRDLMVIGRIKKQYQPKGD